MLLGIVSSAALIGNTTMMRHVARDLAVAVESVRVTDQVEMQLLIHDDARDPAVRGTSQGALMRAVEEATQLVQSDRERQRVEELRAAVSAYLRPGAGADALIAALAAAQQVADINADEARRALQRATVWDHRSNAIGLAVTVLMLASLLAFVGWLRHGSFRAIDALSQSMTRFHEGDLGSRAPEKGPQELVLMARAFNAAAADLTRARQRQTEYVASAIHDLRTPLTAIQLAVGYFDWDRPLPPEARTRELIALIDQQLTRISGLTGDILNGLAVEQGTLPLLLDVFDVRDIVSASTEAFRRLAPEHLLELAIPSQPIVYKGDRARLAQVLNNLLSNAVKYSPPGSRVRVSLAKSNDELRVEVSDDGPGITPEDRERIFEVFQRRSATHEAAPGTSLGLWVSRRVVEAHGGRLELDSTLGEGATFRVVLPSLAESEERQRVTVGLDAQLAGA